MVIVFFNYLRKLGVNTQDYSALEVSGTVYPKTQPTVNVPVKKMNTNFRILIKKATAILDPM